MYVSIVDYMRTGSAFGIIALIVMVIGHMFAIYTIRRPRYVLKRLTALIHLMTGITLWSTRLIIRLVNNVAEHIPLVHVSKTRKQENETRKGRPNDM